MKVEIYDIECIRALFLYCGYNPTTRTWVEFEISEYRNDLFALVKHLKSLRDNGVYVISYNGLRYDGQILQFIIDNHQRWIDYDSDRILQIIKKFSNKIIDDQNYDLFPPFREEELENTEIDLLRVHHYDNENRRTSLKWLEFSMDFYNVEEMPYPHTIGLLTREQIQEIKNYCRNDVEATYEFWLYTIGEVQHEEYQGKNKVQDRFDLIEEMKFPMKALSWSDVKLGDEINKKTYCDLSGLNIRQLYDLKKNRKPTKRFTYGDCIPDYVSFRTPYFQEFFNRMKKVRVNLSAKEEYPFLLPSGLHLTIAKGGIHSNEKNRIVEPKGSEVCMDADVGSQYPHSIIKRGLFPAHLGKAWLVGYTGTRNRRLEYKGAIKNESDKAKKRKLKGLSETFKLALNGGGFGKTNEKNSWQYDPFVQFSCTIGNQFEILMLIEMLQMVGIPTISANTDGIVCLFDRSLLDKYYEVCSQWEGVVGNTVQGKLEFTEYKKIIQATVNDYLAIKVDGEIKKKGDFLTVFPLEKNKSRKIINIAIEKYFVDGIDIGQTIREHNNIFDFCIGAKASKQYHYETISPEGSKDVYHRMIRYYVSTDGKKLLKVKNPDSEADGNDVSQCEAGTWKCTVANLINKEKPIGEYNIDYQYYVQKAEERIYAIEKGRKRKGQKSNPNQISLF
jgi:hypothetical protein